MSGRSAQDLRKSERRSADMSETVEELKAAERWRRPTKAACEETLLTVPIGAASPRDVQLKIRRLDEVATGMLVDFAMIAQTKHRGEWCTFAEFDTSHGDDCHKHQHGMALGDRLGDPEFLREINCQDDVQDAYNEVYDLLEANWEQLLERWRNG